MKRLLALAVFAPIMALASNAFDGSWMLKLDSVKTSPKPEVFSVNNGMYSCTTCAPPYSIKADGTDQPLSDRAYADHLAIKVVDPTTVSYTLKLAGKVTFDGTNVVSADGKKLVQKGTTYMGTKPATITVNYTRVAAGPAGSHAISGSWRQEGVSDASDTGRLVMFKGTDNGIQVTWNGQMVDAKFDGKPYSWSNDPTKATSSFKKLSDTQFRETDHSLGKITDVSTYTLSADGKSITQVDRDKLHGTSTTQVFEKQP